MRNCLTGQTTFTTAIACRKSRVENLVLNNAIQSCHLVTTSLVVKFWLVCLGRWHGGGPPHHALGYPVKLCPVIVPAPNTFENLLAYVTGCLLGHVKVPVVPEGIVLPWKPSATLETEKGAAML